MNKCPTARGFDPILFVPMFSRCPKTKEANYGTMLWPFSHSYAIALVAMCHLFFLYMLSLVGFGQKRELNQV